MVLTDLGCLLLVVVGGAHGSGSTGVSCGSCGSASGFGRFCGFGFGVV